MRNLQTIEGIVLSLVSFMQIKNSNITETIEDSLEKGVRELMSLIGIRPLGFRAPFYLHNNATLRALTCLGFRYDSSATIFKTAHGVHLRMRWSRYCKPFVTHDIAEIPVTGDYTYSLKNRDFFDFLRNAIRDFEWVRSWNGVFVLNNHPQRLNSNGFRFLSARANYRLH